ncbi:unnamed protein product [Urochloa decumbens]|uniref:Uncharacterized protein n=1 Tax=Urochloa decumbens TaxID=240449 RepID=A0ABC9E110_9POAL
MDHHHCHCPPVDHHAHYSPPPCEPSWNTPDHCHQPCPPCPAPPPPPYEQPQDYFWNPAFQPAPFLRTWSSSSSSDADAPSCTVRVEKPAAATGDKAPLLENKAHGGATAAGGPSATEALSVLLFWAVIIGGFVYWYWF